MPSGFYASGCAVVIAITRSASGSRCRLGRHDFPELMDWLHLMAVSAWGGGLLALSASFFRLQSPHPTREGADRRPRPQFSNSCRHCAGDSDGHCYVQRVASGGKLPCPLEQHLWFDNCHQADCCWSCLSPSVLQTGTAASHSCKVRGTARDWTRLSPPLACRSAPDGWAGWVGWNQDRSKVYAQG